MRGEGGPGRDALLRARELIMDDHASEGLGSNRSPRWSQHEACSRNMMLGIRQTSGAWAVLQQVLRA
jgi:hypothetical protein